MNRTLLVLVGGNGSTAARFRRAWPWLEQRFRPLVVELAGQGGREMAPVPSTLAGFAEDLAAQLEPLTAEGRAVCYGHGIGGLVLAHAVQRLSSPPARLVLHAPVGAHLTRRRFPRLMAWRPLRALAQMLLASPVLGPRLAERFLDPAGAARTEGRRQKAEGSLDGWNPRSRSEAQSELPSAFCLLPSVLAEGYRRARSFGALFSAVDPLAALDGLDRLEAPVTFLWGLADRVLPPDQLLAWAEALPRAPVTARLVPGWGHYPFLDWPEAFAAILGECVEDLLPAVPVSLDQLHFYRPRTKAGRIAGMRRAGLPVPAGWWVPAAALENGSAGRLFRGLGGRWAVRSSSPQEDQADHTAAGVFPTLLDVAPRDLLDACRRVSEGFLATEGTEGTERDRIEVIVQDMVAPRAGGVAWVRSLGVDLEITAGRIERGVSGSAAVTRVSLSDLGPPWTSLPSSSSSVPSVFSVAKTAARALRRVHALFDCGTLDVEWAIDADGRLQLLQARPVGERHGARRLLSAANLREILPPDPSPFLVSAAEAASATAARAYARHDHAIATWHEPFSVALGGRLYLNADLLAAIMDRWGLPRAFISRGVGGRLPARSLRPHRFLLALPALFGLLRDFNRLSSSSTQALETLRAELEAAGDLPGLTYWFERAFGTLITENLRINGALTAAFPLWPFPPPEVVTATMAREMRGLSTISEELLATEDTEDTERDRVARRNQNEHPRPGKRAPSPRLVSSSVSSVSSVAKSPSGADFEARWGHRGEYETDPAWPRGEEVRRGEGTLSTEPRALLPDPLAALPWPLQRVPLLAPRHLRAHREWFRDGAMRLWAAFRAQMRVHAAALVEAGMLERPEDLWQLTTSELRALPPAAWRERVAARRTASEGRRQKAEGSQDGSAELLSALHASELPSAFHLLPSDWEPADLFWSDTLTPLGSTPLDRLPLVPGTVTGTALVARSPSEAMALLEALPPEAGPPVLIAPAVDAGWLPVFLRVGGVAAELGGRLSHAATLLRELALPSVLNLAGATACARTGDRVCLRVPPGTVEVIEACRGYADQADDKCLKRQPFGKNRQKPL